MAAPSALPHLRSRFPGDHLLAFRRDVLGFLQHANRTCGDVAEFRLGPEPTVLITHPDHIRDILVTHHRQFIKGRRGDVAKQFLGEGLLNSEGEAHRRQRRLSQPAFHHQRLSAYATVMTDKQVHDEALTLMLAGHETTAVALTWTWYLLSQHPEVEAKLHKELREMLGGRLPSLDDLDRLTYTRMVLTEALRLYPPAWLMTRRNLEAYHVGDYTLPARTFILLSPYLTQRDPRFFDAPEQFQPERWGQNHSGPKYAYFPFGGGPRQCIGEGFAWMEGILVLATLAQQWRMQLVPGHPVGLKPLVTLRPKAGMRMTVSQYKI